MTNFLYWREIDVNKKIQGYAMFIIGFILLSLNALSYLLDWQSKNAAFTILGIVFVIVGLKRARSL